MSSSPRGLAAPRRPRAARRACSALLAGVACLAFAAAAQASTLVYLDGGNVWVANPDGSARHQVTSGGSWSSPSMADDGTILAQQAERFVHLRQNGTVISTIASVVPDDHGSLGGLPVWYGPFDPVISPDGSKVAYWFGYRDSYYDYACSCSVVEIRNTVVYSDVASFTDPAVYGRYDDYSNPAWIDNQHTLDWSDGMWIKEAAVDGLGGVNDGAEWFSDEGVKIIGHGVVSRDGRRIAATGGDDDELIRFYSVNGAVPVPPLAGDPVAPTIAPCQLQNPDGGHFSSPSWSPDGSQLAWSESSGIWVSDVAGIYSGAGACAGVSAHLAIPGGSYPFWSPAALDPTPAPGAVQPQAPASPAGGTTPATPPAPGAPAAKDTTPPTLAGLSARGNALRLTVSEAVRLTVTIDRVGAHGLQRVGQRTLRLPAGRATLRIHVSRPGRYRVTLSARDAAGNASRTARAVLRFR